MPTNKSADEKLKEYNDALRQHETQIIDSGAGKIMRKHQEKTLKQSTLLAKGPMTTALDAKTAKVESVLDQISNQLLDMSKVIKEIVLSPLSRNDETSSENSQDSDDLYDFYQDDNTNEVHKQESMKLSLHEKKYEQHEVPLHITDIYSNKPVPSEGVQQAKESLLKNKSLSVINKNEILSVLKISDDDVPTYINPVYNKKKK
jgi:hypothetical protein